jgi:elongation factor Ts
MTITADAVKQLRERTGAGMMECKKALVETNGDLDAAAENMRKSGLAKADKKASRIAAEGVVVVEKSADGKTGVLVEVNSETDFVARGDDFRGFANEVARAALAAGAGSAEAVSALKLASGETVDERRRALIAKLGENLTVRRVSLMKAPTLVGFYVHTDSKKAALVALEGGDAELARDLAMQVVAASPRYVTPADAPADLVAKEREIETEKAKTEAANANKPAEILAKIVEGRLRKSINEFALTGQVFVKDGDLTIEKLLTKNKASVKAFERFEVGAGIEKKQGDFANEVMEQVKAAQKKDDKDDKSDPPTRH